jgi:hypothetical protein
MVQAQRTSLLSAMALTLAAIVVGGCQTGTPAPAPTTTLPPPVALQPADLKMLAGQWTGSGKFPTGVARLQTTLNEDGSFVSVGSLTGDQKTPGKLQIRDGKVLYESAYSSGTMTFHELPDRWVWKWDGKARDGSPVTNELAKPKR